jgi:hypothetical protein
MKSGTAGLAWRRIRGTALAATDAGRRLRQARLVIAAEGANRQSQLERLIAPDCLGGVDPILFKGWSNARLFPEPALRPFSDFDLFVPPERRTEAVLAYGAIPPIPADRFIPVDLQTEWVDFPDRTAAEIRERTRVVPIGGSRVRILGPEDALRLTCLHFLRHSGSNPLWLCDVAVMLENIPAEFNWEYCLAGQRRRTEWMLAVIRLANQVLGASVSRCPREKLPSSVPFWMVKTVLSLWGRAEHYIDPRPMPTPIVVGLPQDPRLLSRALFERWPNPLESVYRLSWPMNRFTGRGAQILDLCMRGLSWIRRQIVSGGRWEPHQATGLGAS